MSVAYAARGRGPTHPGVDSARTSGWGAATPSPARATVARA